MAIVGDSDSHNTPPGTRSEEGGSILDPRQVARLIHDVTSPPESESAEALKSPPFTHFMMAGVESASPPPHDHLNLSAYEYQPLPTPKSIRLLKIDRVEDGILRCTSKTVDIYKDPGVTYHCLSYTWGNPHADGNYFQESFDRKGADYGPKIWPIVCDAKLLLIHKNLHDALTQLPPNAWVNRLNRKDDNGRTLLHEWATTGGQSVPADDIEKNMAFRALAGMMSHEGGDIIQASHAAGADMNVIDKLGKSALHYAAEHGHLALVKSLIAAGADIGIHDHDGKTAADYAAQNNHNDIVEYLQHPDTAQDAGADADGLVNRPDEWIWVDAVCINQDDMRERQLQVGFMDQIYSRAIYLKVWLGEEDRLTETAVKLIQQLHSAPGTFTGSDVTPYETGSPEMYHNANLPAVSYSEWLALGGLFRRQWFRRIWVFQEVVSSNDVVMFCGRHEIPYCPFVEVSQDLLNRQRELGIPSSTFLTPPTGVAHHLELNLCEMFSYASFRAQALLLKIKAAIEKFRLSALVAQTRTLSSTLPSDKLFALLGLASIGLQGHRIRPDYSDPAEEIYTVAARVIIAEQQSLEIIGDCVDSSVGKMNGLPSWVPDFSVPASMPLPQVHKACGDRGQPTRALLKSSDCNLSRIPWYGLQALTDMPRRSSKDPLRPNDPRVAQTVKHIQDEFITQDWRVLRVEGAMFDRIAHVGLPRGRGAGSVVRFDRSWLDLAEKLDLVYPTGEGRSEVFWRTLCTNWTIGQDEPPAPEIGQRFRSTLSTIICGEAQRRARRYGQSDRANVILEALVAASMGVSHAVQRSSDGSVNGPHFDDLRKEVGDQLDRLATSEPDGKSYFPSWQEVGQIGESLGDGIFNDQGMVYRYAFEQPFDQSFLHVYRRRRLYVTEKGYLGLGPASLDVGDSVWIIPGSKMAVVLRQDDQGAESGDRYRVMGETYVHGIMQGEAVENLSESFQFINLV